ncbi:hypothetical protein PG2022B_0760 [Bifidobacterium animalis subsp. animalis]|nr:hypothetical protein PG2022B_0760 [Bifidobacterium animalis subsp. animalis]
MDARGLTQAAFVSELNKQYLSRFHQKDVSRWLNSGNKASTGTIGFPKYETMAMIADFFGVDVGYLTGETNETSFDLEHASEYLGMSGESVSALRKWIIGEDADSQMRNYRSETLNALFESPKFASVASKLLTLHEMSTLWKSNPERFNTLMESLASDSDLPDDLTFQLIIGAFYGMASESFSTLLKDAYPTPTEQATA